MIFGAIFGFFYAPLVITGLHHMSNAIDLQLIAASQGTADPGTMLWPMIALSNIAQGSAVLGMIYLQRKSSRAQELNIPSCISCYLGVTEPAMFGINLKYVFPFICGMIGSCAAGILSTAFGVHAAAIGVGGLPGILSIQPRYIPAFAICMLVVLVVPFILTVIEGHRRGIDAEAAEEAEAERRTAENAAADEAVKAAHAPVDFKAFLTGKTVAIEDVPDATFAEKVLGDGIAIDPTNNVLSSPVDGTVSVTMDESNHAVGLAMPNGIELLLHIGLDTVGMNGDGFTIHVKKGQRVKAGDKLITFDPEKIKAAGHPLVTMLVVTDDGGYETFRFDSGKAVTAGESVIAHAE